MGSAGNVQEMLFAAREDPMAYVCEDDNMPEPPMAGTQLDACRTYTIFRTRVPDTATMPAEASLVLPEGFDAASSLMSVPSQQQASGSGSAPPQGGLNEYRQLIEYPVFTDDNRKKFHGTLKQYRKWEAEEIAKTRAVMQSLEAKGK